MSVFIGFVIIYIYLSEYIDNYWKLASFVLVSIFVYLIYKERLDSFWTTKKSTYIIKKGYFVGFVLLTIVIDKVQSITFTSEPSINQKNVEKSFEKTPLSEALLTTGLTHPIIEEIVFRGLLYIAIVAIVSMISVKKKENVSIIMFSGLSLFLFGLMHVCFHGDYQHALPYAISGLLYALLYVITRSLVAPIICHIVNNSIGVVSYYLLNGSAIITLRIISIFIFILILMYIVWVLNFNRYLVKNKMKDNFNSMTRKEKSNYICKYIEDNAYINVENKV